MRYGPARGAEMLSLMLGMGVISRLVSGLVADRIGGLRTLMIGSFLQGALRNPSASQSQFGNLIFGFAVTEALGIFSFLIALLLLFAV